ncbi:ArgP/LysG family DNA-binding transcriptional regulator [Rhodobacterales bacterium HKCCE3408]|nr:ArgP/LysG family DNA-binding transcriptional regulator [Rhodobacterales bacterium HKCCE3408]
MYDPAALRALQAILSTGSFDGAAAQLHVTQSAVSQRLKSLEDRVGTALLRRSRPPEPTEAGLRLLAFAEAVGLLERDLARDLQGLLPERAAPVRIAVTADSLSTFVIPALAAVPGLLYDLVIDDQDHSADLLRAGTVAAAITADDRPLPGCDAIPLGPLVYVAFASPGFVDRHFRLGVNADSLAAAPALTFDRKDRLQRAWAEEAAGRPVAFPTHYVPSTYAITEAARAGIGWAVNPAGMIAPYFEDGSLVALVPGLTLETPLSWQVTRQVKPALAGLTAALRKAAAAVG